MCNGRIDVEPLRRRLFAGDDDIAFEVLKEGAVGTIGPSSNLIPRGWKQMVAACLEKRWDKAKRIAQKYLFLSQAIFLETNPQGPKFALSWLCRCKPTLRLPMILPTEITQREIKKAMLRLALPHFSSILNQAGIERQSS